MKLFRSILLFAAFGMGTRAAFPADLNEPVDQKLQTVYRHLHFSQQYPAEAVEVIQTRLQNAVHPLEVMTELAKDDRQELRSLLAMLLGEYGEAGGAKILWELTRDKKESVRLTAAGALARLAHLTHIEIDTKGLEDEQPAVRRLTASTLAAIGGPSAEDDLILALKDDNELVRTDVVKALSRAACGTSKAVNSLIEMLHDPSVNVRDRTALTLGAFNDTQVVEPLVIALKDPDWHVRASAAESLGRWVRKDPALIDALLKVLESDDFALVRDRAADALTAAGDNEKVVTIMVKSLGASQRDVRFHAAQALILSKSVSSLPLLMELWAKGKPQTDVREKILNIFGQIGGPDQLPIVIEGITDVEPTVQLAAVGALRRLKERGGAKHLILRLEDANPHVRAAAARAIGDMGERDVSIKILPLLRDSSAYVRSAAAEALGKLGDRTAIIPLLQVLSGEKATDEEKRGLLIGTKSGAAADLELTETQTKTRAIEALGVLRSPEAVDPIVENGLKSSDPALRAVAAYALGQIRDPRAVEPLQAAVRPYYAEAPTDLENVIDPGGAKVADESRRMKEKESRVRASVAWALGQIGDASAKATLLKALNDQNSLVRDAAVEALAKIQEKQEREKLAAGEAAVKAPSDQKPH